MRHYLLSATKQSPISNYDVVVIGAGMAGLYCALNLPEKLKIAVLSKGPLTDCNSELAQGGIAVTLEGMDAFGHIEDTLKAGSRLNDLVAVQILVNEGYKHIEKLSAWDVNFDKDDSGQLSLTQEGGHSLRRVVHSKDTTGSAVMSVLRARAQQAANIDIFEHTIAVEILTDPSQDHVQGVLSMDAQGVAICHAPVVVLASGGIGHLYQHTTNVESVGGDGIAMAIRAGAQVHDMEMIQFHPTAFALKDGSRHFLISEALRGEGGKLRDIHGNPIMEGKHAQGDLAPRDVVAREIFLLMQSHNWTHVYLDVTHLDEDFLKTRFPNIFETCLQFGIDISKEMIPVCPVEHYSMGGVKTDYHGNTTKRGLYAIGEVAYTGVHGANRLASNSLLETLVFGYRAALSIANNLEQSNILEQANILEQTYKIDDIESSNRRVLEGHKAIEMYQTIREIIYQSVNIYRKNEHLKSAHQQLIALSAETKDVVIGDIDGLKAVNALIIGLEIVCAALQRPQSLGAHQMEEGRDD